MRNATCCVLIACLFLFSACGQRAELAKRDEPEEIDSVQEPEATLTDSTDTGDSAEETGNDSEVVETGELSSLESKVIAAKLPSEAATELVNLDNNNSRDIPVKVVVPTYVPEGFEAVDVTYEDRGIAGPSYEIQYLNSITNECFEISAASGGFGGMTEEFEEVIEIDSESLGKLNLGYTASPSRGNDPFIAFASFTVPGTASAPQEYSFWSPSNDGCAILDFQEAAEIAESLDYLNP